LARRVGGPERPPSVPGGGIRLCTGCTRVANRALKWLQGLTPLLQPIIEEAVSLFCNLPACFLQEEVNEPGQEVDP
jgi:hypothetical protein